MPIRNMWSLECGEVLTAEAIEKYVIKGTEGTGIYFPLHDTGIDLLVVKGKKHVSVQVKESRIYKHGNSWYPIKKWKFDRDKQRVDFYIFLTYEQQNGANRLEAFKEKYIIIPTAELEKRLETKHLGKTGLYNFKFFFKEEKVIENNTDYSVFLEAWDLIKQALE